MSDSYKHVELTGLGKSSKAELKKFPRGLKEVTGMHVNPDNSAPVIHGIWDGNASGEKDCHAQTIEKGSVIPDGWSKLGEVSRNGKYKLVISDCFGA